MTRATYSNSGISKSRKRIREDEVEVGEQLKESLPNLSEEDANTPPAGNARNKRLKNDVSIHNLVENQAGSLSQLYAVSVEAKVWGIAWKDLNRPTPPVLYPEYTKPGGSDYVYRELDFWTSGFFPGSLYLLLERKRRYQNIAGLPIDSLQGVHELQLEFACKYWTDNLHQNAFLSTTHDLGFMIMPWAKLAYELNNDARALETIKASADTLFSRFNKKVGCIRSWDKCVTKKYNFDDMDKDFMVVIDNMMNLNLLFYVATKTGNEDMYKAAVEHARTTARSHVRADNSTTHLIVFDPRTGDLKQRLTNQGYSHDSCWARGQSWAIAGFAETYLWTHDAEFLDTARRCANHFVDRLPSNNIVPWDFDALENEGSPQPPDTSAAMIAAYGMLLIHQAITALGEDSGYLASALRIIDAVCSKHINPPAAFSVHKHVVETVEHDLTEDIALQVDMGEGETILNGATINNYEFAPRRWADHGLAYADYYFLLVGNKLLEMGIGPLILRDQKTVDTQ